MWYIASLGETLLCRLAPTGERSVEGMLLRARSSARRLGGLSLFVISILALSVWWVSPVPAHGQSDGAPSFPSETATLQIPENSPPGYAIGEPVTVHDPDNEETLSYSLFGEDAAFFAIDEGSGQLKSREPLDYESKSAYQVEVRATAMGGLYDSIAVTINVTNVDDAGMVALLPSDVRVGAPLNAELNDGDVVTSEPSWQWAASYDRTTWTEIPNAVSATYVPVAADRGNFLRVRVKYSDGHGFFKMAERVTGKVLYPTETNHPPDFPYFESGVRVVEMAISVGENVGPPVLAADLDRDILTYDLIGDASLFFQIDPYSAQLKVKTPLYNRLQSKYFGVVNVTDGRGGSDKITLRVDVADYPSVETPAAAPATALENEPAVTPAPTPTLTPISTPTPLAHSRSDTASTSQASYPGTDAKAMPVAYRNQGAYDLRNNTRAGNASESAGETSSSKPDEETAGAAAMQSPPEPPTGLQGGANGAGQLTSGADNAGFSFPIWTLWFLPPLVLGAALLAILLNRNRAVPSRDTLPPPTIGPLRRIAPLPFLYSSEQDQPRRQQEREQG